MRSPSGVMNTMHTPVGLEEYLLNISTSLMLSRNYLPSLSFPMEQLKVPDAP